MQIKEYLGKEAEKRTSRIAAIRKEEEEVDVKVDEIKKENEEEGKTEEELKALGEELDLLAAKKAELEAEKAEKEAELAEIEAQLKALDEKGPEGDPAPSPERAKFLTFSINERGKKMNLEERTKAAEEFKKNSRMTISHDDVKKRAVAISGGQIGIPTELQPGIEKPLFVDYSSIFDFVTVRDMTGAGYNRVALQTEWSEANEVAEGGKITESDPQYGFVTITPEKGFKTISYITNEVLKVSPLDYYGNVEDNAMHALRKKIARKITAKALGAVDDDGVSLNEVYELEAINEDTLRDIVFSHGGEDGIYGPSLLLLNKKDLVALGKIKSDLTKQSVYDIKPNPENPNMGTISKDGLTTRYMLDSSLPAFSESGTAAGTTCMLYGDFKAIEVDLFGDYDIRVSEDFKFDEDMLAIRGTAMIGVGVMRKYALVEVKKPAASETEGE